MLAFVRWRAVAAALCRLVLVGCCWAGAGAALAQNVLILQTTETGTVDDAGAANIHQNLLAEFSQPGATVTVVNGLQTAGAVTAATFAATPPYDLVVVSSVYQAPEAGNMAALQAAVAGRSAKAFALFLDGYVADSVAQFVSLANGVTGAGLAAGSTVGLARFPLNTNSPHAASFAGMPEIHGGVAMYVDGVAADNALYLQAGATPPPAGGAAQTAYGLFYPQSQVNGGSGACLFGMTDGTQFYSGDGNAFYSTVQDRMAPALFAALLSPGGACGVAPASVSKAFAPQVVALGGTAMLTITLNNLSNPAQAVSGAQVQDTLPAPLVVSGTATSSCTGGLLTAAVGSADISLAGTIIPVGGCTVTVPVRFPNTAATAGLCPATVPPTALINTIVPPAQFSTARGQDPAPATATLSCDGSLPPVPPPASATTAAVPTLGDWARAGLAALLLLLGGLALRRRAG